MKTNGETPSSAAPPTTAAAPAAPSTPSAPAAAPAPSDHLSQLTAEALPGGEREPSPAPPGPSPSPAPEPAPSPEPAPKIKIRGIEYSLDAVLKNPELSQALLQTYEQFPALQRKYVELLENLRQQSQQPPPPA